MMQWVILSNSTLSLFMADLKQRSNSSISAAIGCCILSRVLNRASNVVCCSINLNSISYIIPTETRKNGIFSTTVIRRYEHFTVGFLGLLNEDNQEHFNRIFISFAGFFKSKHTIFFMTHSTLTKMFTRTVAIFVMLLVVRQSHAQCDPDNTYYLNLSTSANLDSDTVSCVFGGEYLIADVCAGVSYEFSMCNTGWDSQITLYDQEGNYLAYDDDGCGVSFGPSNLFWTATYTGLVEIMVDQYNCTDNISCGQLVMTQFGTCSQVCTNNNTLYNVNATPAGVGYINSAFVEQMWGGDYVNVAVCEEQLMNFQYAVRLSTHNCICIQLQEHCWRIMMMVAVYFQVVALLLGHQPLMELCAFYLTNGHVLPITSTQRLK